MSRREEEFKHRTSIFEGAYRAWSHLGGLDAEILDVKLARELDPISYPHLNDTRDPVKKTKNVNDDGSARLDCPYEPLPRSGLSHPFIQAILAPWLGPNAEKDAVELGLATLRTWWQHRRKGENKSSVKTLGTAKMRIVVDKYTRHFFDLAHCLVVSDDATPPRTLHTKMKQLAKGRRGPCADMLMDHLDDELSLPAVSAMRATLLDPNPSPLEKLHAAQMQHSTGFVMSTDMINVGPLVNVKGKCIPGKIDLPGMVEAINRHSNQLAFTGGLINRDTGDGVTEGEEWQGRPVSYGDPKSAPVVFQNTNGDNFIVMNVNGITCAHCVKIVETVLKGCNGGKSPIAGLLDAAADRGLSCVMIQIEHFKYAKRVAFESARNLSLVGYTAVAKEVHVIGSNDDSSAASDIEMLQNAIVKLAKAYPFQFFDFNASCSCPDSGVFRDNCPRYEERVGGPRRFILPLQSVPSPPCLFF